VSCFEGATTEKKEREEGKREREGERWGKIKGISNIEQGI